MQKITLDREILTQKYVEDRKSVELIAKELEVCGKVVTRNLKEFGIVRLPKVISKNILIKLYDEQKLSIRDIANILEISSAQVRTKLIKNNIPRRHKSWKSGQLKNGKNVQCTMCGKVIYRKNSILSKYDVFFCTWKCSKEYQSSQRNTGLPEGWRRFREYKIWRNSVLVRDSFTCKMCGSTKNLVVHHIIEAQDDIELRYDVSNGIVLCQKCHIRIHINDSHNYIESLQRAISVENPNIGESLEIDNAEAQKWAVTTTKGISRR